MKEITFVTSNQGKLASAKKVFENSNISLVGYNYDLIEPRSDDVVEIAKSKVSQAYNQVNSPCFALDVGFYIPALKGFPKAFVNHALDTIGIDGILKLMEEKENRECYFFEALAFYDGQELKTFTCKIDGTLTKEKLGSDISKAWSNLWEIFIPLGYTKTLAQMTEQERAERKKNSPPEAIEQFAKWANEFIN